MTAACMTSATEPGGDSSGSRRGRGPLARAIASTTLALIAAASLAASPPPAGPPPPAPASPAAAAPLRASSSEALEQLLAKADKALAKAAGAAKGTDAGRVSAQLIRAEELLVDLQSQSGLEALDRCFAVARDSAGEGDLTAAAGAMERARTILPRLNDYTVLRQAEEASRAALTDAARGDAAACIEAVRRCEAAVLAPVLLARIVDARRAVQRGRGAMVRRDMRTGAEAVAEARAALAALSAAGALSRARFALEIGAELVEQGATIAARDQLQKALRDLDRAIEAGPEERRQTLTPTREAVATVWRRVAKPAAGDPRTLLDAAAVVESVRRAQT